MQVERREMHQENQLALRAIGQQLLDIVGGRYERRGPNER
jgi:hypothetical protein